MTQKNPKNALARHWSLIVYPESAPENWESMLTDVYHMDWARSPLHDKDLMDDGSGNFKKPHYHVQFYFAGKKSFSQVREIADALNAPIPQVTKNFRGAIRYFFHMDNPEKAQYALEDSFAVGMDLKSIIETTADKKMNFVADLKKIMAFCKEKDIMEMDDLLEFLDAEGEYDLFYFVGTHTVIVGEILRAKYHKYQRLCENMRIEKQKWELAKNEN